MSAQIRPAPEMRRLLAADYLIGLGTFNNRMLTLADIDRLTAETADPDRWMRLV